MIRRQDSAASTNSRRDRHITPYSLQELVKNIITNPDPHPLAASSKQGLDSAADAGNLNSTVATDNILDSSIVASTADTTLTSNTPVTTTPTPVSSLSLATTLPSTSYPSISRSYITAHTQAVHGFSTSHVPPNVYGGADRVSATITDMPAPYASPAAAIVEPAKTNKFALGGSCSSTEAASSSPHLASVLRPASNQPSLAKQTSFNEQVSMRTYAVANEAAIDSDSESEIDDDEDYDDVIE